MKTLKDINTEFDEALKVNELPFCQHPDTIDAGDSEHQVIICTVCGRELRPQYESVDPRLKEELLIDAANRI